MTEKEKKEYIINKIKDAPKYKVNIIIGEASLLFKKLYTGYYDTITTADEVREFLAKWNTPYDKPIVFEDISLMIPRVQTFLLKFIEEPPAPLIILASNDNVSPIILSRCRNIIKVPSSIVPKEIPLSQFIEERQQQIDEERTAKREGLSQDIQTSNIELDSLKKCPLYTYMITKIQQTNNLKNPDKYLRLLSSK